jgi:protein dithiol:quinone oxidoreductase
VISLSLSETNYCDPPPVLRFPRLPFTLILAASAALVVGSLGMAHFLNLSACPLCILQRMLHMVLVPVAALGLVVAASSFARRVAAAGAAVVAGTGAFVAGYQTWLQRFAPQTNCAMNQPWWERFVYWAGDQAPMLFQANGLCSDPAWKLLDLSLAEWSLITFTGLVAISLLALFRR